MAPRLKVITLSCNEILTPEEVSDILKVPLFSVRKLLRDKEIPGKKVGKHWRIAKQDLEKFMRA
jgi:excisionase family DNA binding protein